MKTHPNMGGLTVQYIKTMIPAIYKCIKKLIYRFYIILIIVTTRGHYTVLCL